MRLALAALLAAALPGAAFAASFAEDGMPSFDCTKAGTKTEKAICERWLGTAMADRMLADAVAEALARADADGQKAIRREQKAWLKTRDACGGDSVCITDRTLERLRALDAAWIKEDRFEARFGSLSDLPGGLVIVEGQDGKTGLWLIAAIDEQFACGLDTLEARTVRRAGGEAVVSYSQPGDAEDPRTCQVTITVPDGGPATLESDCQRACGMNGWMDGEYPLEK